MATKIIPIHDLPTDAQGFLQQCSDSGEPLLVELADHRLLAIAPVDEDDALTDDLLANNPAFRLLTAKSLTSPRKPFVPVANRSS